MKINYISFRGYNDPYPCGGGKVEKIEWETKHGCRNDSNSDAVAEDIDAKKSKRDYEVWSSIWAAATSAYDD